MSSYELLFLLFILTQTNGLRTKQLKPKECWSLPPPVNHAILRLHSLNITKSNNGAFSHGTRVDYHCEHKNYRQLSKPDGMVVCNNGSWGGVQPNCKTTSGKPNFSSDLAPPRTKLPNGCVSIPKLFQMRIVASRPPRIGGAYDDGTRLYFSCNLGHLYPRHNNVVCSNRHWNGTFPRCVISQCDLPKKVEKGTWTVISHNSKLPLVQSGKLLESVRIQYDCEAGKVLVGSKWRVCLSSGMWSGENGMCVSKGDMYRVCPAIGGLKNGRIRCNDCGSTSNMYIGVVLVASCDPGYGMLGGEENPRLRCIFEGDDSRPRWSRSKPRCIAKDELEALKEGNIFGSASLWSQDLTVVIVVSTVVMGSLLMIFTAVVACRCVRHATNGRRGRSNSPLHHHHHHPYSVTSASVTAGHRNEDCVALIVPPSYEEAIRDGGPMGPNVSMGTAGPASTMTPDGVNTITMSNSSRGPALTSSRLAHVLSRSPRIRSSGESRDYRPLQAPFGSRQSRRAAAANATMSGSHPQQPIHHHGNISASAGEADSVSRHSTQTSGSHGPAYCLSGSLETMAVSDGTSVTLRTYESQHGSNPSLISTRPQTGSLCETQQSSQSPQQQQSTNRGAGEALNVGVGCMTPTEQALPARTVNQAPVVTAPSCGNGSSNGNANSQGCISPGNIIGSEKEDSISSRS